MLRAVMIGTMVGVALLGLEVVTFAVTTRWPERDRAAVKPVALIARSEEASVPRFDHGNEWVDQLLARPPFTASRRMVSSDGGGGRQSEAPRLTGLVSYPDGRYALFQADGAGHTAIVGEGATLGGWTVQSIGVDGVTVRNGQRSAVLRVTFAAPETAVVAAPASIIQRARDKWGRHLQSPTYLERRG